MRTDEHLLRDLDDACVVLQNFLGDATPRIGVILGSGLNPFADELIDARVLSFGDVPHMRVSTAEGHRGQFVVGRLKSADNTSVWVLCMQGRLHGYEGATSAQVAFPVWLMHRVGVRVLVTTNAVGAINPAFHPGDFCLMTDQINLTGRNPLCGIEPNMMFDRFVPMKDAFDPELRTLAHEVARKQQVVVHEGVYAGLLGPSFETPAEIRMLRVVGADTVAMSVWEEVIAARHCGMRVLGLSLCSNMACGVCDADPCGGEVMDIAASREDEFSRLMAGIIVGI